MWNADGLGRCLDKILVGRLLMAGVKAAVVEGWGRCSVEAKAEGEVVASRAGIKAHLRRSRQRAQGR